MPTRPPLPVALAVAPALAIAVLAAPVGFGLIATVLPAFGWFPALGGETLSLAPWRELLATPGLWRSAAISLAAGLLTTAAALAAVIAFVAGWSHTRAFRAIQHLISPLLSVPHAAAAFGIAFLIAPSGWLMRLVSPELTGFARPPDWLIVNDPWGLAMMAGLLVKELPFLFLVTLAALPQVRSHLHVRTAASLGYGRIAGFVLTAWPLTYPQIRLAVFAVIAYASSAVDVAIILGPTRPAPLAVRLVEWMNDPDLAMRFKASAGALLQLGLTATAILLWVGGERIAAVLLRRLCRSGRRFRREGPARLAAAAVVTAAAAAVFAGLAVLALWSFAGYWSFPDAVPRTLTLDIWRRELPGLTRPLAVTVGIGLAATALAVAIALACLERESRTGERVRGRSPYILYLPLLVPQVSFVFGMQLAFLLAGIGASILAVVLAHLVFVLPYVLLSLSDPWHALDPRYARVAASLGAGAGLVFWRVRLPMLAAAILVGAAVGFAVSIGQYLPTLLIGAGRWPTVTTEAVALASGGDRRVIGVYAFVQMLLPFLGFMIATLVPAVAFMRRRDMRPAGA
ncbi:MAG: ABC transporter permease [Alphaproteobacteria bacterium]|nr:MAG: ABC transporter permease [Alphaproteobacteria bacterium]